MKEDTEIDGVAIPAGSMCWVMFGAANRDPEVFPDPDRFDVGRADNPHLAFGGGTHRCLGVHLARMETQEAIGALVARSGHLERDTGPLEWGQSVFRVPAKLMVRLAPA